MKRRLITSAFALAMAVAGSTAAHADKFVYSFWFGANHTANTMALQPYLKMLREESEGKIDWDLVPGAQLASGPGTPEAVGDGLIDAGLAIAPYQPKLMAATNTIFAYSLLGDNTLAAAGAMNEAVMLGCPQCQDEYHRMNGVGFAGYATTPYVFMCRDVIESVEDLKGLKVRSSGAGVLISEIAGATPVSMSPGDATTALERGTLDCVLGAVSWLKSYSYQDVVKSVVDSPMGTGGPPLLMFVNRDVWQGMTPEMRALHIKHAPDLVAGASFDAQMVHDAEIKKQAEAAGVIFTPTDEGFESLMAELDTRQRESVLAHARDAGVENPEKILDYYLNAYDRWQALLDEEGRDRETFVRLLWDEIYSKVDPETL